MKHSFTYYLKHLAIWLLFWLLLFLLTQTQTSIKNAFWRANFNIIAITFISYLSRSFATKFYENKVYSKWWQYGSLLCVGFTSTRLFVELFIFKQSLFGPKYYLEIKVGNVIYQGLFYLIITLVIFACSTFYQIAKERRRIENNLQQLQYKHVEAQLNYLRSQINPHFLFNTLHNIYSAVTLKKEVAGEMILKLSDLLHYVTYDGLHKRVALETELQKMKAYIELFQLKTPHPLNIQFDAHVMHHTYFIEPVLLLPFVENALKHGNLTLKKQNGFLTVDCKVILGVLTLVIINSFNINNKQKDTVGGVGLTNIKSRLELLYPNNYSILIDDNNGTYSVTLQLNLNYAKHA